MTTSPKNQQSFPAARSVMARFQTRTALRSTEKTRARGRSHLPQVNQSQKINRLKSAVKGRRAANLRANGKVGAQQFGKGDRLFRQTVKRTIKFRPRPGLP